MNSIIYLVINFGHPFGHYSVGLKRWMGEEHVIGMEHWVRREEHDVGREHYCRQGENIGWEGK